MFPLPDWISTYSLGASPRAFGSARAGGRLHAGCDLYAPTGSKVLAIAEGTVRSAYPFYWGTYAVEVDHDLYGIVRYGEIRVAPGIARGTKVTEGQLIGAVAQLINPNPKGTNPHPMLHLEWYTGKSDNPLTTADAPYKRRSDLRNPMGWLHNLWTA